MIKTIYDNTCIKKEDAHIYYNVDIINEVYDTYTQARFLDYRSQPLLKNAGAYHVNLVRARFPCSSIPKHIFSVKYDPINTDNINNGVWEIAFIYNNTFYKRHVQYISRGDALTQKSPNPPPINGYGDNSNGYYNIFSYYVIVEMINKTFNDLKGDIGFPLLYPAPYIEYDEGKFNLFIYKEYAPSYSSYNGVQILINETLQSDLFGGYYFQFTSSYFKFLFDSSNLTPHYKQIIDAPLTGTPEYYKIIQESLYSPQYLSPLLKIIVTSSSLKCRNQLVQTNKTALSANNNNLPILFSFAPDSTTPGATESILNYYSSSYKENNILDIMGDENLNNIELEVFWQDKFLNIRPFYLAFSQTLSIVLLFSKI